MALPDRIRLTQRLCHILLRFDYGSRHIQAKCQTGSNRRGEGATGAMRARRSDARQCERNKRLAVVEEVHSLRSFAMPSFEDNVLRAKSKQLATRIAHVLIGG